MNNRKELNTDLVTEKTRNQREHLCNKCRGRIVMNAFCKGECGICKQIFWSPNTPANKICENCVKTEEEKGNYRCRVCGDII